jgi:hypothetical protein
MSRYTESQAREHRGETAKPLAVAALTRQPTLVLLTTDGHGEREDGHNYEGRNA